MTEEQKNDAAPQSAQGDLHRENEAQEHKGLKVPRTVWALGFGSLLMDISSEMIHALLPLFMAGPLGASAVLIGLVEGAGEGAALITKVFSGAAADRFITASCLYSSVMHWGFSQNLFLHLPILWRLFSLHAFPTASAKGFAGRLVTPLLQR